MTSQVSRGRLVQGAVAGGRAIGRPQSGFVAGRTPPGRGKPRIYDGRDLAQTALTVSESSPDEFTGFLRPEDRHRYVMIRYKNGIEVPSWALSDGTLRLLALTLLAYVPDFDGVYLIEEPEIGVHPTAIETIKQSLSSVYSGQVLLTATRRLIGDN